MCQNILITVSLARPSSISRFPIRLRHKFGANSTYAFELPINFILQREVLAIQIRLIYRLLPTHLDKEEVEGEEENGRMIWSERGERGEGLSKTSPWMFMNLLPSNGSLSLPFHTHSQYTKEEREWNAWDASHTKWDQVKRRAFGTRKDVTPNRSFNNNDTI